MPRRTLYYYVSSSLVMKQDLIVLSVEHLSPSRSVLCCCLRLHRFCLKPALHTYFLTSLVSFRCSGANLETGSKRSYGFVVPRQRPPGLLRATPPAESTGTSVRGEDPKSWILLYTRRSISPAVSHTKLLNTQKRQSACYTLTDAVGSMYPSIPGFAAASLFSCYGGRVVSTDVLA